MDIPEIRQQIELLPDLIYTKELKYNEEKAQLKHLENLTKPLLANLRRKSHATTVQGRDDDAYSSQEYQIHIEAINIKQQAAGSLEAELRKYERMFDAMRSLNKNI